MTNQTTPLRDRIAAALYDHSHPGWAISFPDLDQEQRDTYLARADAVLAVLPATTIHDTDTGAESERREQYAAAMENARRDSSTGAVLAMARMVDAAMAVADAEINEHREHIAVYRKDSAAQYQIIAELQRENAELRRVADETAATEIAHQPRRGDQVEAWLKAQRDDWASDRADVPATYDALDDLLDLYRLHADTGTPLGEHVCEARVVGDCECLEQPAAGARQDKTVAAPCVECDHPQTDHEEGEDPVTPGHCRTCPDDDARHDYQAATVRQDGAQS